MAHEQALAYIAGALVVVCFLLPVAAIASPADQALPLVSAGRYVEAQALLTPYVRAHPEDLAAQYWLGRALLGSGRREAAIDQFRAVLAKKPTSSDSRLYLAQALWELRRPEEAIAELQELLRRDPKYAAATALLDRIKRGQSPVPPVPPEAAGGEIAFVNGGLPIDPGDLDLQSYNFKDFTFSNAPAEWLITSGTWATTNRWTCSPQWSWYGGYANGMPAAIWTKEEFAGDQDVEMYVAFKMGVDAEAGRPGAAGMYKGGNDVNIAMCGDGGNLASGYTFMVGGNHNSVTRIMKGTKVLAETSARPALFPDWNLGMPSTYQWHRKWWAIRARKSGDRLQLYVDERLAVEARDPQPLHSGRVAIWTYDNGIIIPRVRIYYQALVRPRTEPAGQEAWIEPTTVIAPPPLLLTSRSHPSVQGDFEYNLGPFRTLDPENGAVLNLVPGGPTGAGHCLAVINRFSGGNFGTMISEDKLDAKDYSRLSFDYRVPPEAKVNFYLAAGGKWWEIVFSGLDSPSPRTGILGRIPGVVADNQWHHAEFDLLGALEQALGPERTVFTHFHLANFNQTDYLGAGFGGNPAGCTYYLDNFFLGSPRKETKVVLASAGGSGEQFSSYTVTVDQTPLPSGEGKPHGALPAEVSIPGFGLWYIHVQPTRADGSAAGTCTYAVRVANQPLRLAAAQPASGQPIGGGEIVLEVDNPGGAGIDPKSVAVAINGRTVRAGEPGLRLDLQRPALHLDPAAAGVTLKDGGELQVQVAGLTDRLGNALPATALKYTYSLKADTVPPPAPIVRLPERELLALDFEDSLGGVTPWGSAESTSLALDSSTAASGRSSLRVTSLTPGGTCGVLLCSQPFDAGKYRLLSFDYKFPPYLAVDLALNAGSGFQTLRMTNNDSPGVVGQVPGIVADDKWHHAEVDLYALLRAANPARPTYQVLQLLISDFGWQGNPEGATYNLDNVRLSPIVSAAQGLQVAWDCPDLGGISGLTWKTDTAPGATLPEAAQPADSPLRLAAIPELSGYLFLRARDAAGNWSPVSTRRLLVESIPPTASAVEPAAGARVAPSVVRLNLTDANFAGVNPQSIILSVGGTDYRVDGRALTYNANSGELIWSCEQTAPRPTVFADGQEVKVALRAAEDFAGNAVAQAPQWAWIMDYSQDKVGPRLARLESPTHPTFYCETFESGQRGQVVAMSGCNIQPTNQNPASGQYSLSVKKTAGTLQARLLAQDFPADKYPVLSFDYRIGQGVRVNLAVQMLGNRYLWALTGPTGGTVGQVPGVQADGQWHKAYINLAPPLRAANRQGALVVNAIYLLEMGGGTPVGADIGLDNLVIGAASYGPVVCRWQATDPTGIKGYSYLLTQNPADLPPEQVKDQAVQQAFTTPAPGVWFLRIRAQDGAGNWGPVETYGIINRNPG